MYPRIDLAIFPIARGIMTRFCEISTHNIVSPNGAVKSRIAQLANPLEGCWLNVRLTAEPGRTTCVNQAMAAP
jgi:hypothetical protein